MNITIENSKIRILYTAFALSIIFSLIPHYIAAIAACFLFIGMLVAAYAMRAKVEQDRRETSFTANHTSFIIASLWASAVISLVSISGAAFYMMPLIDYSAFMKCPITPDIAAHANVDQIMRLTEPCMDNFLHSNDRLFLQSTAIAGLPILVYMVYRMIKGGQKALKAELIEKPKRWL